MEDQSSLLQGNVQEDSFDVVVRGYSKRQVDDYVMQCQHHIRDLANRLALAEQETARVRAEAAEAVRQASVKPAPKPVHEEVSERLAQILRLANEEAERERSNAAEEIAAIRAEAVAETQELRERAFRETESLRRQVITEIETKREQVQADTEALLQRAEAESEALRADAEAEAAEERARAQAEAERVLGEARAAAEQDVAQARAEARRLEDTARSESERLVLAAQQRADALIGEAERRAHAVNTVLGGRLETLTATHRDVVARLTELRTVLVDVLGKEDAEGPFEVPPPPGGDVIALPADSEVQTAGEVAAAYEAPRTAPVGRAPRMTPIPPIPPAPKVVSGPPWPLPAVPAGPGAEASDEVVVDPAPTGEQPVTVTLDEPEQSPASGR